MLRLIGIAATGASISNSATVAQNNPTLRNNLKVVIDAVGLGQRTVEILGGMDRLNANSAAVRHFGSSGRPAVKFLGALERRVRCVGGLRLLQGRRPAHGQPFSRSSRRNHHGGARHRHDVRPGRARHRRGRRDRPDDRCRYTRLEQIHERHLKALPRPFRPQRNRRRRARRSEWRWP